MPAEMPQGVAPPLTLAALRAQAIRDALTAHPTRAAAARALGIDPRHLARLARRAGVVLERRAAGRPRRG